MRLVTHEKMTMAMTAAEKKEAQRARLEKPGLRGRLLVLTDEEFKSMKEYLERLRKEPNALPRPERG
jgi:hypothetical protein